MSVYTSKKLGLMFLFSVLVGILVVKGTSWGVGLLYLSEPPTGGGESAGGAPSSPIDVRLSVSKAPPLNQAADLTCTVTSALNAPNTTIRVTLPEGFALLSGDLSWRGDILKDGRVEVRAVIKAIKVGNWTIEATAGYPFAGDGWYGDVDRLYIHVSEDSAYVSETPFSTGGSESETKPP